MYVKDFGFSPRVVSVRPGKNLVAFSLRGANKLTLWPHNGRNWRPVVMVVEEWLMPQDASGKNASPFAHISEAITGEYAALDDWQRRQDAATFGNNIEIGAFKTSGGAVVKASGEADLLASGDARVYSSEHAKVAATGSAMIVATDHVKVTASGTAAVLASGEAKVYASDRVTVTALDGSEIYASGHVLVRAFGYCTVYASGDSQVEVAEHSDCTVYLYGNAAMHTAKQ